MYTRTFAEEMLRSTSSVERFVASSCLPVHATQERPGTLGNLDQAIQKPAAYRW